VAAPPLASRRPTIIITAQRAAPMVRTDMRPVMPRQPMT